MIYKFNGQIFKNKIIFLGIILTILFLPQVSLAANWYVDNVATGSNNGTSWTNAWQSFAAISWSSIQPGDTIYISGGITSKTYNEQLNIGANGVSGNPITIRTGQDAGHNGLVIIDGQAIINNCIRTWGRQYITITGEKNGSINMKCVNSAQSGIMAYNATNVKFHYIEVDNAGTANNHHGIQFSNTSQGGNEISYSSIHDAYQDAIQGGTNSAVNEYALVTIHNNNLYNISDDGIQSGGGLDIYNNTIGGMRVPPRGSGHPDGIQAMGGYVRIYNNTFHDFIGNSNIFVDPINLTGQIARNIYVYNNLFYTTQLNTGYTDAIEIWGDTPNPPNGLDSVYVLNNTIVDFGATGISVGPGKIGVAGTLTNTRIQNNIIYNTYKASGYGTAIMLGQGVYNTSDVVVDYNTVHEGNLGVSRLGWNGVGYAYNTFVANGYGQANGIHSVPNFISYIQYNLNNDYHLSSQDTSSRDRGINLLSYFTFDKDGVSRPQGSIWDIGAYEYIQTAPSSDTTPPSAPTGLIVQ